jgi:hypothetical protein
MNDLEKLIMEEISTLDEMRLIDVLGFIRLIKTQKRTKQHKWIEDWLEQSRKSVRRNKAELRLTPADLEQQVRAIREDE